VAEPAVANHVRMVRDAELTTAQGPFADGKYGDAKMHATRVQAKLKLGTPASLRADDIITYKPPKLH